MKIYKSKEELIEENKKILKDLNVEIKEAEVSLSRKIFLKFMVDLLFIGILFLFYFVFWFMIKDEPVLYGTDNSSYTSKAGEVVSVVDSLIKSGKLEVLEGVTIVGVEEILVLDPNIVELAHEEEKRPCLGFVTIRKNNEVINIDASRYCD